MTTREEILFAAMQLRVGENDDSPKASCCCTCRAFNSASFVEPKVASRYDLVLRGLRQFVAGAIKRRMWN